MARAGAEAWRVGAIERYRDSLSRLGALSVSVVRDSDGRFEAIEIEDVVYPLNWRTPRPLDSALRNAVAKLSEERFRRGG
jgi:hypothetical protein